MKRNAVALALVVAAALAGAVHAYGEQGPPVPIRDYQDTTAADLAAGNAAGSAAAYAWMAENHPEAVAGIQTFGPAELASVEAKTEADFPVPGGAKAREMVATTPPEVGPPGPNTIRLIWNYELLHRVGPYMRGKIRVWPGVNIEGYVGTIQMVRILPNGSVRDVGLEWSEISEPALPAIADMGTLCSTNPKTASSLYKYLATFIFHIHGKELPRVKSAVSPLYRVNC